MEDAPSIIARWGLMESDRAPWDGVWQQASDYTLPRKGPLTTRNSTTNVSGPTAAPKLHDTTAIDAVAILAAGHSTAITPAGTKWFAWESPEGIKSDEADAWYNQASEKAVKILTAGNFHTMLNEVFEDRSGFGLCCLGAFPHPDSTITFQAHPVGSFCIEEDAEGNVNTIFLRRGFTISQLAEKFGEKAFKGNEVLSKSWEAFKEKGINASHDIIHAVFPRLKRNPKKRDIFNMPIASVWVSVEGQSVLSRSGYEELPYMANRYLKRTGSKQQYGYGPFERVRANIVNVNKTKQILQVVRQKEAVPPVLIPDDLTGNVDTRPGGKTVFNGKNKHLPQEWLTGSRSQGLLDEVEDDRLAIRSAYHTDSFRMFADRDKQMTAREVSELSAEKIMPLSPTFTRFTADFQVMMERIFAILFRAGAFGKMEEIPQAVIRQRKDGQREVPPPKVVYQSRLALAIRQVETSAADRAVERAVALAPLMPEVMDNIDGDAYLRGSVRNDGASEDILRPEKARDELRKSRAEAQQQQVQMDMAQQAAETAGKAGIKFPGQAA